MTEHDTCEEQALVWFTRSLDAPLPADQQQAFLDWLDASPANAEAYARVENLWQADSFESALRDLETDLKVTADPSPVGASSLAKARPADPRSRTRRWTPWATAAAILLTLGTWLGDLPLRLQADYLTATGEQRRITLSDGSKIVLGSDSAISAHIDDDQRSLQLLRGDIYLEAAHDPLRPLRIKADEALVEVVGTRFSVSLREDDVGVAVDEGKVRLSNSFGAYSLLGAGAWQHLRADRLDELHLQGSADQHGWTEGRLIFQDRPLADVLKELGRQRHAPILLFGDTAALRVSGNYKLDDPEAVVAALARLAGAELIRLPGGLLIVH
ncbi:FecR domain-containing protein [Pseudomonas sp. 148P]|uniref:FecR domain-containing protein n=1 Tax=Pseudomonas ulcerans TaxID=3115852 RepID=A0ABU7I0U1_9PSED|nr:MULTISPECIES: FecR domain-containing protein [unclassified Pseudomonas]MEE1926133.1 FecR domain-containing protein [Pseudomonas sp. 147P]MEE1937440.1 FecR domain-containing protein [Pseudomonas sp. 148P]